MHNLFHDFFAAQPSVTGVKGLLFVGQKIVVYRRDADAPEFADYLDLPGGGTEEDDKTPFQTFKREIAEEFGLNINPAHITYAKPYQSAIHPGKITYFAAAQLPAQAEQTISLGDEGQEYMLLSTDEYLARHDAWPIFQQRTRDYLASRKTLMESGTSLQP